MGLISGMMCAGRMREEVEFL